MDRLDAQPTIGNRASDLSPGANATLAPSQILGHYRVVRLLGRGGMGEVYLAEHTELQTSHALKTILPEWAGQPGFQRRFQSEARLMARLRHPHIVRCTDSGSEQGIHYLIMDFIEGPRGEPMDLCSLLAARREKGELLDEEEAAAVGLQICDALAYAHEYRADGIPAGIIHRDLKPANILVDRNTHLLVTDFGLARLIGEGFESRVIEQSMLSMRSMGPVRTLAGAKQTSSDSVGTFDYMSPEQREGRIADCRSDVYAMGAILYELLTGRKVAGVPARPSRVRPGLNKVWDEILHERALAYDPADRFENARELMAAVQDTWIKRDSPASPYQPRLPPTPPPRPSPTSPTGPLRTPGSENPSSRMRPSGLTPHGPPTVPQPASNLPKTMVAVDDDTTDVAGQPLVLDFGGDVKIDLVWIPPGSFQMGSPHNEVGRCEDEGPQRHVTLTRGFWMGKYPVTQQLWQNVMRMNPSQFKKDKILGLFGGAADPCLPVEQVSWDDCQMFLRKLNNVSGGVSASLPGGSTTDGGRATYILRLPTEAQWEYACRAGTTTRFNTGDGNDDLKRSGWYDNNSRGATQPVGYKEANTWGLCDMHGNVWEWCQDRYSSYSSGPLTDPPGPASGVHRVLRGGSWGHRAEQCRSATRLSFLPSFACSMSGFRVVVNP